MEFEEEYRQKLMTADQAANRRLGHFTVFFFLCVHDQTSFSFQSVP